MSYTKRFIEKLQEGMSKEDAIEEVMYRREMQREEEYEKRQRELDRNERKELDNSRVSRLRKTRKK